MTLVTIARAGRGTRVRSNTGCREVTWRVMAGVAIMAVAISAAGSSFSLVIQFSICERQYRLAP